MAAMKKHLNAVLRIAQEPCEYFDNLRVHELLTCDPQGYLNYICSQWSMIWQQLSRQVLTMIRR